MAHTSTSPNYQILALDLGRRQVALEERKMVAPPDRERAMQLRDAIDNHPLVAKYMACCQSRTSIPEGVPGHHRPAFTHRAARHDARLGLLTSSSWTRPGSPCRSAVPATAATTRARPA